MVRPRDDTDTKDHDMSTNEPEPTDAFGRPIDRPFHACAAVVADSPELAQARERIAALEAERAQFDAEILRFDESRDRFARATAKAAAELVERLTAERDAALARVDAWAASAAALFGPIEGARAELRDAGLDPDDIGRRGADLVAAAQPKPRDESVPPPGWRRHTVIVDDGTGCEALRETEPPTWIGPPLRRCDLAEAWRIYDAEHGYAPDEARIRADERARVAKELHRMAVEETESDQRSAGLHEAAMFVERGEGT